MTRVVYMPYLKVFMIEKLVIWHFRHSFEYVTSFGKNDTIML